MSPTEKGPVEKGNGIPRFQMPMILMQSVLVPTYSNEPSKVKPSLPVISRSVCSKSASENKSTCRLPFEDGEALARYSSASGGRRSSAKPLSSSSRVDKGRIDAAKKRLNQRLHDEHRVWATNLKLERESIHSTKTIAAIAIQRHWRGLTVRKKKNPDKYALLRASLETNYSKEELSELVSEAIRRSGVNVKKS